MRDRLAAARRTRPLAIYSLRSAPKRATLARAGTSVHPAHVSRRGDAVDLPGKRRWHRDQHGCRQARPRRLRHSAACRAGEDNASNVSVVAHPKAAWRTLGSELMGAPEGPSDHCRQGPRVTLRSPNLRASLRLRHGAGGVTRWLHQDMSDNSLSSFMPTIEPWRQEGGRQASGLPRLRHRRHRAHRTMARAKAPADGRWR